MGEWYPSCTSTVSTDKNDFGGNNSMLDVAFFGFFKSLSLGGALAVFGGGIILATIALVLIFLKDKK